MSYFASSASPEIVHWHHEKPGHLIEDTRHEIYEATRSALHELEELIVSTEHTLTDIADHFGIYDFSHHLANKNLTGATISYNDGHLEIRRDGQVHATSFPVSLIV